MKIIQIITLGSEYYGAQKHVFDLCCYLKKDGHEVVAVVGNEGKLTDLLKKEDIDFILIKTLIRNINPFMDIQCFFDLQNLFKKIKPDLVALHSSKAGIIGRLVCWKNNIPNTFTAHGWSFAEGIKQPNRIIFQVIENIIARMSQKIITVSHIEKQFAIEKGIPASKLEVIHYGIEDSFQYKKSISNRAENVVITMVAGFRYQKDHDTLIKALSQLQSLNWEVYFLGDGHLEETYKEMVASLGMTSRFHFEGAVSNVDEYLMKTDIFVLITHWEGLPISIIEAMSCSLPIIATDVAGVQEAVENNINGYTVLRKDIVGVRKAIEELCTHEELRMIFGNNSRKIFEERFTINMMYKKTLNLYKKLIIRSNED